ncbi:hypothetical protein HDU84_005977 [Entophlyctis sp. JEL0112]|nr:hypothetical protein HDU84_005977 [Entophlyctis sp. JEL0112]
MSPRESTVVDRRERTALDMVSCVGDFENFVGKAVDAGEIVVGRSNAGEIAPLVEVCDISAGDAGSTDGRDIREEIVGDCGVSSVKTIRFNMSGTSNAEICGNAFGAGSAREAAELSDMTSALGPFEEFVPELRQVGEIAEMTELPGVGTSVTSTSVSAFGSAHASVLSEVSNAPDEICAVDSMHDEGWDEGDSEDRKSVQIANGTFGNSTFWYMCAFATVVIMSGLLCFLGVIGFSRKVDVVKQFVSLESDEFGEILLGTAMGSGVCITNIAIWRDETEAQDSDYTVELVRNAVPHSEILVVDSKDIEGVAGQFGKAAEFAVICFASNECIRYFDMQPLVTGSSLYFESKKVNSKTIVVVGDWKDQSNEMQFASRLRRELCLRD